MSASVTVDRLKAEPLNIGMRFWVSGTLFRDKYHGEAPVALAYTWDGQRFAVVFKTATEAYTYCGEVRRVGIDLHSKGRTDCEDVAVLAPFKRILGEIPGEDSPRAILREHNAGVTNILRHARAFQTLVRA